MSRRKQSNPRQIKRSPGDMEPGEEPTATDTPHPEGPPLSPKPETPEPDAAGETDPQSLPSPGTEHPPPESPGHPEQKQVAQPEEQPGTPSWSGPDELEPVLEGGQTCVRARRSLAEGLAWGPFHGSTRSRASPPGLLDPGPALDLLLEDQACWLHTLPRAPSTAEANVEIHRKDGALWCRLTRPVPAGGLLRVVPAEPSLPVKVEPAEPEPMPPVKVEPAEPTPLVKVEPAEPTPLDIQLLPQQAGMASILATAVVNKDVFPCKDCGIWYRSERNLQAHLLYYCASRQGAGTPATAAADEKPKETYPNERVCPFPQCRKSCPSASSLEIHMRSHSGERPFACLICLSAFTTKANCERHLRVHTDTLSGVCHSCGFISTTRDILYSHLVTSHMVCQPGSKADACAPGPAAPLSLDGLAFPQHAALHGASATADRAPAPTPPPAPDRRALAEVTNGEVRAAPQNGANSEPPGAPRAIKVEAEEPAAEPGSPRSRTPSPRSPGPARVKAEPRSPTPGASPGPGELGLAAGALFLAPLAVDAGAAPPASEILARMSELVHGRLRGAAGAPAGLFAGAAGATCFECDITFNNVNNFYVHKRLYCSGRRAPDDAPPARRARAPPAPPPSPGPAARDEDAGRAATPDADAGGRASEGSPSPGSGADEPDDDPRRTLCEACNIRFSRHETYTVHKRYYCASRHDPPPRRPAPAGTPATPGTPAAPPPRTRRRRKLYELPAAGPAPTAAGPALEPPGPAPEPPASPRPPCAAAAPADGPIDLSKRPRRQAPETALPAPGLPALADYHECTACRVSFHSLDAYLAHKQFACPAPRPRAAPDDAPVACPYCPPNGLVRGDLGEHFRRAHGLRVADGRTPPPAAPRDSPQAGAAERREPPAPDGSPRPGPPASPAHSDKGVQTPVPNGNHRFCRLCNIRFSSLSTFIAHKKYYCSSHAAEHVK